MKVLAKDDCRVHVFCARTRDFHYDFTAMIVLMHMRASQYPQSLRAPLRGPTVCDGARWQLHNHTGDIDTAGVDFIWEFIWGLWERA